MEESESKVSSDRDKPKLNRSSLSSSKSNGTFFGIFVPENFFWHHWSSNFYFIPTIHFIAVPFIYKNNGHRPERTFTKEQPVACSQGVGLPLQP